MSEAAWLRWGRRLAMALAAAVVLVCWPKALSTWIGFGLPPTIWRFVGFGVVALAVLVACGAWEARRSGNGVPRTVFWSIGIVWSLVAGGIWYWVSSPLSRDASIAFAYETTTWWMAWAGLMFVVSWRWIGRLGLLAVLLAGVAAFLSAVKLKDWDGAARPNIVWRFEDFGPGTVAAAETSPAASIEESARATEGNHDQHDYPRFRGADGLATVRGANLARSWSAKQPMLRWKRNVGAGWSALVVAGGRVLTQEQRGGEECVACYDRKNGDPLWEHRDTAHYQNAGAGDGPRATPTVDGDRVFSLGATGIVNCLDLATGQRHWTVNILTDAEAQAPGHGTVGSPLVVDGRVILCAGGANGASLVAYDAARGKRAWAAGNDPAGYTSPLYVELGGAPQILIITTQHMNAHDPASGKILWSIPWQNPQLTNCSQPFPVDTDRLFASANYGTGCALVEITRGDDKWKAEPRWANRSLQTKFCSVVVHDGHAYSFDDEILECVRVSDGRRMWKKGRYGHGQLLLADDLLVIQAEDGRVVLVEATGESHRELATMQALDGKTWNHPALAGRELFVRNDHEAACYELPTN